MPELASQQANEVFCSRPHLATRPQKRAGMTALCCRVTDIRSDMLLTEHGGGVAGIPQQHDLAPRLHHRQPSAFCSGRLGAAIGVWQRDCRFLH